VVVKTKSKRKWAKSLDTPRRRSIAGSCHYQTGKRGSEFDKRRFNL